MKSSMIKLGEIIEAASTVRANAQLLPILSMTMRDGLVDQDKKFRKRIASLDTSNYKVVAKGQLVVGFPIDEGVLAFQEQYSKAIVSPAYDVWNVTRPDRVSRRYLEWFLRSPLALKFFASKLRSTTARRRSVPTDIFLGIDVPLPSLEEQVKIAEILDQADALRRARRRSISRMNDLVIGQFREMFGDLAINDRGWPRAIVGDFVESFQSGKNLIAEDQDDPAAHYKVLKVSAVTSLQFRPEESKALPASYQPPAQHFVAKGDLLFSRANTTDLIGATALVDQDVQDLVLPDKLWKFVWRSPLRVEPLFVWFLFRQSRFREELGKRATGTSGSMKNISQDKVLSISTGLPPLIEQGRFVKFAKKHRILLEKSTSQLNDFEKLFASLQTLAFRDGLLRGAAKQMVALRHVG